MSLRENLKNGFLCAAIGSWLWLFSIALMDALDIGFAKAFGSLLFYVIFSAFFPIIGFALFRRLTHRSDSLVGNFGAWLGMLAFTMILQKISYGEYIPFVQGTIAGFTLAFMRGWDP